MGHYDVDANSRWLINWWDRLSPVVNGVMAGRRDLCQDIARYMDEFGNEIPSDACIEEAKRWEAAIEKGEKPWEWEREATP
jgi:hypothetical protein